MLTKLWNDFLTFVYSSWSQIEQLFVCIVWGVL